MDSSAKLSDGNVSYVFELGDLRHDLDSKLLLLTLQGLVNRDAPRLLIDGEGLCDWGPADKHWQEVYSETKGISFQSLSDLDALVGTFRDRINGAVLYDPELDASRYVAVTMAGLNSWLPVSPQMLNGELSNLPIRDDLRGRWADPTAAYEWALAELMPQCSPSVAFSAGQSHDDVRMGTDLAVILALDYAVSQRAFVFNLSPCAEPGEYGHEKIPVPAYPEDARIMQLILERLHRPAKVYGWAEPEWTLTSTLSRHGHFLMCGTAGNLSFHAAVPAAQREYRQPATRPRRGEPEPKHYIAFMTNEGDTPRVLTSFFFGGWLNHDRGRIPVNWGVSPTLLHDFPAFAEYYFSTATENDYFYAGVSGTGYAFIDQLPSVEEFALFGKPFFDQFDIHAVDSWDEHEFIAENYEVYAEAAGAELFTLLPRGGTRIQMLDCGVPVIVPDERIHYKAGKADRNVPDLLAIAEEHPAPFLIPCYGGLHQRTPTNYLEIMERLPPEKFEAVTLADMAELAVKIASSGSSAR